MFGALLAWIALFRLTHYIAFAWEVSPYTITTTHTITTTPTATMALTTNKVRQDDDDDNDVEYTKDKIPDEDIESSKITSIYKL